MLVDEVKCHNKLKLMCVCVCCVCVCVCVCARACVCVCNGNMPLINSLKAEDKLEITR